MNTKYSGSQPGQRSPPNMFFQCGITPHLFRLQRMISEPLPKPVFKPPPEENSKTELEEVVKTLQKQIPFQQ